MVKERRQYGIHLKKHITRKALPFAIASLLLIVVLVSSIVLTIFEVNQKMEAFCFEELRSAALRFVDEFKQTTESDRTILRAVAAVIASREDADEQELCSIMNAFSTSSSHVSCTALLRPDNQLLFQDGQLIDMTGRLDFTAEAQRGTFLSEKSVSVLDPQDMVFRSAVPVVRNGETIYMLYGVVSLSRLADVYTADIYGGQAAVIIEDGATGDFLMDTRRSEPGSMSDLCSRTFLCGYTLEDAVANMSAGVGGNLGYVCESTGETMYMHYEPIGINSWNIVITVAEEIAFSRAKDIRNTMLILAFVVGFALVCFTVYLVAVLLRSFFNIRRMGTEDHTTGLQNRSAFDQRVSDDRSRKLPQALCLYLDANGLHEVNNEFGHHRGDQMLQAIGSSLLNHFPRESLYRVGGDEFVALCEHMNMENCRKQVREIKQQVAAQGYSVSVGLAYCENECGWDRVILEADRVMLDSKRAYYTRHDRREPR